MKKEGGNLVLVESRNVTLGSRDHYNKWPETTWRVLDELYRTHHFVGAATEAPPSVDNLKQTQLHWYATGAIWTTLWRLAEITPKVLAAKRLKSDVAKVLGKKANNTWSPDKATVGAVLQFITGSRARTSHENDAAMIAISAFWRPDIKKYADKWSEQGPLPTKPPAKPRIQA